MALISKALKLVGGIPPLAPMRYGGAEALLYRTQEEANPIRPIWEQLQFHPIRQRYGRTRSAVAPTLA
jgi:hypothetical protein